MTELEAQRARHPGRKFEPLEVGDVIEHVRYSVYETTGGERGALLTRERRRALTITKIGPRLIECGSMVFDRDWLESNHGFRHGGSSTGRFQGGGEVYRWVPKTMEVEGK